MRHVFWTRTDKAAASPQILVPNFASPYENSFPQLPALLIIPHLPVGTMAEQAYFGRFQTFAPDPQATVLENFAQLAISNGWGKKSQEYKDERKSYMIALADTHIESIERGGAAGTLAGLQGLCKELRVCPIPTSITQCKKVCHECSDRACWVITNPACQKLRTVHVCIVDLIDNRRLGGTRVHIFPCHRELQQHIKKRKHYFPKYEAKEKEGGLLKVLLRKIKGYEA